MADDLSGSRFFERSPFKSARFLIATGLWMATLLLEARIAYLHWELLRSGDALVLLFVGVLIFRGWFSALREHGKINESYTIASVSGDSVSSALKAVMIAAADFVFQSLFDCLVITILLLVLVNEVLKRVR